MSSRRQFIGSLLTLAPLALFSSRTAAHQDRQDIMLRINVKRDESLIVSTIVDNYRRGGRIREIIEYNSLDNG